MTARIRFIHVGDLHGHLVPRPHVRADGTGSTEGGQARMATLVASLREQHPNSVLVNTGDTIQGCAEALFTRGQALVDAVDRDRHRPVLRHARGDPPDRAHLHRRPGVRGGSGRHPRRRARRHRRGGRGRGLVLSGTSHDLIAEAIRAESGADIGHLRGFRYGTHVAPGPITLEDLFHYLPVGAQVARHLAGRRVTDVPPAIELSSPLPPPSHGNPEIQPLGGRA